MGMKTAYNDQSDMTGSEKLAFVENLITASVNGLRRLAKTHEDTWWNGKDGQVPSSLDHVFASEYLVFHMYTDGAEVEVSGWVNQSTTEKKQEWINEFSDHSLLYGEIHDS